MDSYYIGRTNAPCFVASHLAKCESLPKSERIRFFVNRTILKQPLSEKPERVWTFISEGVTKLDKQSHQPYKLEFEVGNWDKVFEIWQILVQQKGVGNNAILLSSRTIVS